MAEQRSHKLEIELNSENQNLLCLKNTLALVESDKIEPL